MIMFFGDLLKENRRRKALEMDLKREPLEESKFARKKNEKKLGKKTCWSNKIEHLFEYHYRTSYFR